MKKKIFFIISILSIFGISLNAQNGADINLAVKYQITSSGGTSPTFTAAGIVIDELSRWDATDIQVGDSLYVIDGPDIFTLKITVITLAVGNSLSVTAVDPSGTLPSLPTGQSAILRGTSRYNFPTYISGLRDDLQAGSINRASILADAAINLAEEITEYSGGSGVAPAFVPGVGDPILARNGVGELYRYDGSVWVAITPPASTPGWALTGNSGTIPGTNFLGTTDSQPIVFKTNNLERMRLVFAKLGIGTSNPVARLSVQTGAPEQSPIQINTTIDSSDLIVVQSNPNDSVIKFCGTLALDGLNGILYINTTSGGGEGTEWTQIATTDDVSGATGWALTGNSGTNSTINFIGTIDNQDVIFKRNNLRAGLLNNSDLNTSFGVNALNSASSGSSNSAFGHAALGNNTSGISNTALGNNALLDNLSGSNNIAIGKEALMSNTTGGNNIAIGVNALMDETISNNNLAIGNAALQTTTGSSNIGIGYHALTINSTANNNIAIGANALALNTTASNNLAIGPSALGNTTVSPNLAIGQSALYLNTTGNNNIAIGSNALPANTTGSNNLVIGDNTMISSTTSSNNVAIGREALKNNTTGATNFAIGRLALTTNTTGSDNLAIGDVSLTNNLSGLSNLAIGKNSLTANTTGDENLAIGYAALSANNVGVKNIGIGVAALASNTSGEKNVAIGRGTLTTTTTISNNIAIGDVALQSNTTGTPNLAIGVLALNANTIGINNMGIGINSLKANISGNGNFAIGPQTLQSLTTGSNNLALGLNSGKDLTTGSGNILIGNVTAPSTNTTSNEMNIGNILFASDLNQSNPMFGVNTAAPVSTFHVNGSVSMNIITTNSAAYTALFTDYTIVLTLFSAQTVTIPSAASSTGRIFVFSNPTTTAKNTSVNYLNFAGTSVSTIAASGSLWIQSNGTDYYQIK